MKSGHKVDGAWSSRVGALQTDQLDDRRADIRSDLEGNVMVCPAHLGSPVDVRIPFKSASTYEQSLAAFKRWAEASKGPSVSAHGSKVRGTPTIIQLCHSGRQAVRLSAPSIWNQPKAPSAVAVTVGEGLMGRLLGRAMFGIPKEMTMADIDEVVQQFVDGALLAREAGFDGVQLHASHGYLLAQFLSPNVNLRTDDYGGTPRKRMKLILRIVDAIRKELPMSSGFCVGIKLNSADYVKGGLTEQDALDNVRWLAEHGGLDFIEISGGTYESPIMLGEDYETQSTMKSKSKTQAPSSSTSKREAFFISFASSARALLASMPTENLPTAAPQIMLTGGFRTREGMASALASSSTDLVGLGRPACADPRLPHLLLDPSVPRAQARSPRYSHKAGWLTFVPLPIFMPGISTLYHTILLAMIAHGQKPDYHMTLPTGMWRMWFKPALQALLTSWPVSLVTTLLLALIGVRLSGTRL